MHARDSLVCTLPSIDVQYTVFGALALFGCHSGSGLIDASFDIKPAFDRPAVSARDGRIFWTLLPLSRQLDASEI